MTIPEEAVEAAAKMLVGECNWQGHSETWRSDYLEDMRAALEAALPLIPIDPHKGFVAWFHTAGKDNA